MERSSEGTGTWTVGAASDKREARARSTRRVVRRSIAAAIVAALVAAGVVAAWPEPVVVDVAPVRVGSMRVTVDEAGRARVRDRYVVSAPFAGNVGRAEMRAGDEVKVGQTVASLVPAEPPLLDPRAKALAEARVASARGAHAQSEAGARRAAAALEDARRELRTAEGLAASEAISKDALARSRLEVRIREEELTSARFATDVAVSEITAARATLGLLHPRARRSEPFELRAPVSGVVLRVLHADAGVVGAGTPLLEIGDPAALEIVIDVLTADASRIRPGAAATIRAWGGAPLAAHVRRVEPSAVTRLSALGVEEQRVDVLLDLDAPRSEWSDLGDGWRVEASVEVRAKEDAVVVPSGAVFRRGDGWATFVVSEGRAALRAITPAERSGMEVEITAGLAAGDRVIVHPSDAVSDGTRVDPR